MIAIALLAQLLMPPSADSPILAPVSPYGIMFQAPGGVARPISSKLGDVVSVKDFGAVGNGIADDTLAIQAAVNAGGETNFPDGTYLTTSAITLKDNSKINFSLGATMIAGANGMTFFQSLTHAYYAEIWDGVLDGNGKTGVTGFDLTNFRDGSGLFGVRFNNMATGIYFRSLDWSAVIWNNYFSAVNNPIRISGGSSTVEIWYPQIDGEFFPTCTTGIQIDNTGLSTIGVLIHGGYVQGCVTGILDQAIGTRIDHTYFEVNSVADISESGAQDPYITHTQHWGSGVVAIKGRTTTGARIEAPVMGSGNRSTGLYDWDGTNSNTYEWHAVDSGSKNTPLGTLTGALTFEAVTAQGDLSNTDRLKISTQVNPTGGGLKHARFGATCATAAAAGATCTSTYSWANAAADASYTPICWGVIATGTPIVSLDAIQLAASITVRITAATAVASSFAGVYCEMMHD